MDVYEINYFSFINMKTCISSHKYRMKDHVLISNSPFFFILKGHYIQSLYKLCVQVTREGGSIGEVELEWNIQNDPNNDMIETSGKVTFSSGQLEADIQVKIRGDTVAELDEVFLVQITSVSLVSPYNLIESISL